MKFDTQNTQPLDMDRVRDAAQYGLSAGRNLSIGDRFVGAMGAAKEHGYADGSPEWRCFIAAYLDGLNAKSVTVGPSNIIIEIEHTAA